MALPQTYGFNTPSSLTIVFDPLVLHFCFSAHVYVHTQ